LRTRKHFALLVRLAVERGRPLTRDYLIDLLWPDAAAPLGRHSLAQGITVLRARLGRAHVLVHKATLALDEAVDVDVLRLDQCDGAITGRFLDGFEVPGARGFEEWKEEMHARLLPRLRDCLVRMMDASRRVGDFGGVERHALVLRDLDPHSEDATRGLMEARAWVGDRSNALKVYARFEARLAEELGAKPSASLVRVAHLLREGRSAPRPPSLDEPPLRPEKPFRAEHLVGREREFSILYDAFLAMRGRAPRIVVLTGDPGVGKTTLTNALAATCQMEGAVVARTQAYDAERELPFGVLAELVRQLATQRAIGGADPESLAELSRICGEVRQAFPGVPPPPEWSAEIVPLRLAVAFWRVVEAAAEDSPLVLIVDDLHAADTASTAVLHMVARKLTPVRLLLILTGRASELRAAAAAAAFTGDESIAVLSTFELDPLGPADARQLLVGVVADSASELPEDAAARILRVSSGNPLALALLAREWSDGRGAGLLQDLDRLDTQPAATLAIPRAIRAVVDRQRRRLEPAVRAALDLAAVLGRRLAALQLYQVVGLDTGTAAEALGRLREEGILREVQEALEFRNELVRAQVYYALPAPPRQQLHRRVGELLAATAADEGESALLETAWHFLRGGDQVRGREYGIRGAEAALAVGAPHEAEQVLEVLVRAGGPRTERGRDLLLLALALIQQSKALRLPTLLDEIAGLDLSPRQRAEAARVRATTEYLLAEAPAQYADDAAQSLNAARLSGDRAALIRALFEYARSGAENGLADRLQDARHGLTTLAGEPGTPAEPFLLYSLAYCMYHLADVRAAMRFLHSALELYASQHNPVEESMALNALAVCHHILCETQRALDAATQAEHLARRVGDDSRRSLILGNAAATHLVRGEYERSVELGGESVRLARECLVQPFLLPVLVNLGFAEAMRKDSDAAEAWFDEARAWMDVRRGWRVHLSWLVNQAEFALLRGARDEAFSFARAAERLGEGREALVPNETHYGVIKLMRLVYELGEERSEDYADQLLREGQAQHPLAHLTAAFAVGWVQRRSRGAMSPDVEALIHDPRWAEVPGRWEFLLAEGFGG
jgi:DNA-binding SARP family transcriptional activator